MQTSKSLTSVPPVRSSLQITSLPCPPPLESLSNSMTAYRLPIQLRLAESVDSNRWICTIHPHRYWLRVAHFEVKDGGGSLYLSIRLGDGCQGKAGIHRLQTILKEVLHWHPTQRFPISVCDLCDNAAISTRLSFVGYTCPVLLLLHPNSAGSSVHAISGLRNLGFGIISHIYAPSPPTSMRSTLRIWLKTTGNFPSPFYNMPSLQPDCLPYLLLHFECREGKGGGGAHMIAASFCAEYWGPGGRKAAYLVGPPALSTPFQSQKLKPKKIHELEVLTPEAPRESPPASERKRPRWLSSAEASPAER